VSERSVRWICATVVLVALIAGMIVADVRAAGMTDADREAYSQIASLGLVVFAVALLFSGGDR
jgi:hypothetical protein